VIREGVSNAVLVAQVPTWNLITSSLTARVEQVQQVMCNFCAETAI